MVCDWVCRDGGHLCRVVYVQGSDVSQVGASGEGPRRRRWFCWEMGIIVVANNVSTVVKNANSWTPNTVGVLAATVAMIYVIFQIYFDWA